VTYRIKEGRKSVDVRNLGLGIKMKFPALIASVDLKSAKSQIISMETKTSRGALP
jgi:hypothetical protein